MDVGVWVGVAACEPQGVWAQPPPGAGEVLSRSLMYQPGDGLVKPPGKAERLKPRARVEQHLAEGAVLELLRDGARGHVDHGAHAAALVDHQPVGVSQRISGRRPAL